MAISFMVILAITIEEWPLIAIGIASLLVWRWTGDLRLYAWVQFFPCLALPLIFLLFAPKFSGTIYWLIAALTRGIFRNASRSSSRMPLTGRKSFYYGRNNSLVPLANTRPTSAR